MTKISPDSMTKFVISCMNKTLPQVNFFINTTTATMVMNLLHFSKNVDHKRRRAREWQFLWRSQS